MLWVKLLFVDTIHPQSNKFGTGVKNIRLQVTQNLMTDLNWTCVQKLGKKKTSHHNSNAINFYVTIFRFQLTLKDSAN